MKTLTRVMALGVLAAAVLAAGCTRQTEIARQASEVDRGLADIANSQPAIEGILQQQVIYAYHFVPDTAALNSLGEHDLIVLAGHYRTHPGELSVRRDGADAALHARRVEAVRQYLGRQGVNAGAMELRDAPPKGEGMAGESVVLRFMASEPATEGPGGAVPALLEPMSFKIPSSTKE